MELLDEALIEMRSAAKVLWEYVEEAVTLQKKEAGSISVLFYRIT